MPNKSAVFQTASAAKRSRSMNPGSVALKIRALEAAAVAHVAAGDHEHAVAAVVDGRRVLRRRGHVRLHHLEHEQAVALDQARVDQLALEVGVALGDERRLDLRRLGGREAELLELVDAGPVRVADADDGVDQVERRAR